MPKISEVQLNDEAFEAIKQKPLSEARLTTILNSNLKKDMPTSEEARWMAFKCLEANGIYFKPPVMKAVPATTKKKIAYKGPQTGGGPYKTKKNK